MPKIILLSYLWPLNKNYMSSTLSTQIDFSLSYKVKDITLADWGRKEIRLAEAEMPGLMAKRLLHWVLKLSGAVVIYFLRRITQPLQSPLPVLVFMRGKARASKKLTGALNRLYFLAQPTARST
jgi:hypothetical protein